MLDYCVELQKGCENSTSAASRKRKGQVFTPPQIARFMAGLFSRLPERFRLLDPGAGIGSLTAAVCERLLRLRSPRFLESHVFENDPHLIPLLEKNLENCRQVLQEAGHTLRYVVHAEDFVVAASPALSGQRRLYDAGFEVQFDGAIMNPPYFKVRKDSLHAKLMAKVVHGQPNVYTFFMTLAAQLLKEGGELVAVTPRSFCNGLYFRGFRQWFFRRMALDHLHLFESRTEAFKNADVLQESLITKVHRLGAASSEVAVTTSFGSDLHSEPDCRIEPADQIVDNSCGDYVVRIPAASGDREIMKLVEAFPARFSQLGLRISTGPVVMFRATEFLLSTANDSASVPLLLPHNVKPFRTVWPIKKNGKPLAMRLCEESRRLLLPAGNYVLLKRFSAKEEKRRLRAGCLLRSSQQTSHVALENHLNYVYHAQRELTEDETYGLAALFNSVLFDRYFRTISGNTQVNATEIRAMSFPDLRTVTRIGRQVRHATEKAEIIVLDELGIDGPLREQLLAQSE